MAPVVQRPEPPYLQVAAGIRNQILAGRLREGDRVPSAREITREWGVAMATATKVLAALRSEGFVRTIQGVGTVVAAAETVRHGAQDRVVSSRRTGRIYPPGQSARITAAGLVDAPEHVADALGLRGGALVIRRHRITYQEDRPVSSSTSWFDGALADAAPKLLGVERILQGTSTYIEEITGRRASSGRDQLAADAATEQDAEDLGVPVQAPVLRGRNWYRDTEGVIEYGDSVAVAGRWTSYEYKIGDE